MKSVEERLWAKVDKSCDCWVWTGSKDNGYGRIKIAGRLYVAHRIAYELLVGPIPSGHQLDHTCHNRACVNPDHLRPVTPKQNKENVSAPAYANNTSGVRGVSWSKQSQKWQASVRHGGRLIHVGRFAELADAESAVMAKRLQLFTHNDIDRTDKAA
jgi:hypothetical protein